MDEEQLAFVYASWEFAQKFPAKVLLGGCAFQFQLFACPVDRLQRDRIESVRIEKCCLIMVAQNGRFTAAHHQIQALDWIGPVTHNVPETDDAVDVLVGDIFHDHLKSFKVAMDVTDQCSLHDISSPT